MADSEYLPQSIPGIMLTSEQSEHYKKTLAEHLKLHQADRFVDYFYPYHLLIDQNMRAD